MHGREYFIIPCLCKFTIYVDVNFILLTILTLLSLLAVVMLAPQGTKKHPIINAAHRNYLKKKIYQRAIILYGVYLLLPNDFLKFITLGILLQLFMLLLEIFHQKKEKDFHAMA